jgi:hypothetical protein
VASLVTGNIKYMTPSEAFVSELCKKSFLPFWSFSSPLRKKEKELCDVLIVCGNDIVIISVKDIKISGHPDEMVQYERWQKKAIRESIDQIYGAERFMNSVNEITLTDKVTKIQLPAQNVRHVYRIAVAFGGENRFPLETGQFGQGFVHVFDEESTFTVLDELDTVTDFINYLKAKENFLAGKRILVPKEVDFLALYINTELIFDFEPDFVSLDDDLWADYSISPEYRKWRKDIKESYVWDYFVKQLFAIHIDEGNTDANRTDLEKATRVIALETRMNRMELGVVLNNALRNKVKARIVTPFANSDHSYVIMPLSKKNWKEKEKELQLRCLVARYLYPQGQKVVGIAIGSEDGKQYLFDIAYFNIPEMTADMKEKAMHIRDVLGYFKNPQMSRSKDMR